MAPKNTNARAMAIPGKANPTYAVLSIRVLKKLGYRTDREAMGTAAATATPAASVDTNNELRVSIQREGSCSPAASPRTTQYPNIDTGSASEITVTVRQKARAGNLHRPSRTRPPVPLAPGSLRKYRARPRVNASAATMPSAMATRTRDMLAARVRSNAESYWRKIAQVNVS